MDAFGRHVVERPDVLPPVRAVYLRRRTKVAELQVSICAHEDIGRLHIAVHYTVRVEELERERDVREIEAGVLASQGAVLVQEIAEGLAGGVLHEEVVVVLVVEGIDEPAKERVPREFREVLALRITDLQRVSEVPRLLLMPLMSVQPCVLALV